MFGGTFEEAGLFRFLDENENLDVKVPVVEVFLLLFNDASRLAMSCIIREIEDARDFPNEERIIGINNNGARIFTVNIGKAESVTRGRH